MREIETDIDGIRVRARELRTDDLDTLVAYWHDSDPKYLKSLGVDLSRLGSRAETRARLSAGLDAASARNALTVVAEIDGAIVAYSNLRTLSAGVACAHLHTLRQDRVVRSAVYKFFPEISVAVAQELGVTRLRFEASVGNEGINRYLQSFGLQPAHVFLSNPDGLAHAGEFNVYEVCIGSAQ